MTPDTFLPTMLDPGLAWLAANGGPAVSDGARTFLLAVAGQEANWTARYQSSPSDTPGPARSWWQFESGGGVKGVLRHRASSTLAKAACAAFNVVPTQSAVWRAMEGHDLLAAVMARLLLWTDPYPIPTRQDEAWQCYANRLWRPGKPHPKRWPANWNAASAAVQASPTPMGTTTRVLLAQR